MKGKSIPINPWLEDKVLEYREKNGDLVLRIDYEISVKRGSRLSWSQHLTASALASALESDSFLLTLRRNMDLPSEVVSALYRCHVDCVADLLQLSEEEFEECARVHKFETKPVKKYLKKHGYKLLNFKERTYKVQSLPLLVSRTDKSFKTWVMPSPGAEEEFDVTRPFTDRWWLEKYYPRYEYSEGEDRIRSEWQGVKPALIGDLPLDYQEFFFAVRNFYEYYGQVCQDANIVPSCSLKEILPEKSRDLAHFNNDILLSIKRDYVFALIDLFERTNLFKYSTPGEYLSATDEGKLEIAEKESESQSLSLLLITYVELRLDFENLLIYFKEITDSVTTRYFDEEKSQPLDPSVEKAIAEYRNRHSDEEIREKYRKSTERFPDQTWEDFLIECAMDETGDDK